MEVFEGVGNEARSHAIGGMHSERVSKKIQRFPTSSPGGVGEVVGRAVLMIS